MDAPYHSRLEFSEIIAKYTKTFVGREWLAEVVESAISDENCRMVAILGGPGIGKTAFIAQLASQNPQRPCYFIRRDSRYLLGPGDAKTFYLTIGSQIAKFWPDLFQLDSIRLSSTQRIKNVKEGGRTTGVSIGELTVSPFCQIAIEADQQIDELSGSAEAIRIDRLIADVRALSTEDLLEQGILAPARRLLLLEPASRLVILVDALDEARFGSSGDGIASALARLPTDLPSNLRIIFSSRPDLLLQSLIHRDDTRTVELDPQSSDNKEDLSAMVGSRIRSLGIQGALAAAQRTEEEFASKLLSKAEGNFLYVASVLDALELAWENSGVGSDGAWSMLARVETLPPQLEGLFSYFLNAAVRWTESSFGAASWRTVLAPLLGTLAVAREQLDVEKISHLTGLTTQCLRDILRNLRQFVQGSDGRQPTYRIYHSAFAEFLLDPEANRDFWIDPAFAHERIARHYRRDASEWSQVPWESTDDYGLRHIAFHVVGSPLPAEGYYAAAKELASLACPELMMAKRRRFESHQTFAADVDLLHAAICSIPSEAILPRFRLCVIRAWLLTVSANVGLPVLQSLAAVGRLPAALGFAALVSDVQERAVAYFRLGEALCEVGNDTDACYCFYEAIKEATSIKREFSLRFSGTQDKSRDGTLESFAKKLADRSHFDEALDAMRALDGHRQSEIADHLISKCISAKRLDVAISTAYSVGELSGRARCLSRVALLLAQSGRITEALETAEEAKACICQIELDFSRDGSMARIARTYALCQRPDEAIKCFELATQEGITKDYWVRHVLDHVTLDMAGAGDLRVALSWLQTLERNGWGVKPRTRLAVGCLSTGALEETLVNVITVLQEDPNALFLELTIEEASFASQGHVSDALRLLLALRRESGFNASEVLQAGQMLREAGVCDHVIAAISCMFGQAYEGRFAPTKSDAVSWLAWCCLRIGDSAAPHTNEGHLQAVCQLSLSEQSLKARLLSLVGIALALILQHLHAGPAEALASRISLAGQSEAPIGDASATPEPVTAQEAFRRAVEAAEVGAHEEARWLVNTGLDLLEGAVGDTYISWSQTEQAQLLFNTSEQPTIQPEEQKAGILMNFLPALSSKRLLPAPGDVLAPIYELGWWDCIVGTICSSRLNRSITSWQGWQALKDEFARDLGEYKTQLLADLLRTGQEKRAQAYADRQLRASESLPLKPQMQARIAIAEALSRSGLVLEAQEILKRLVEWLEVQGIRNTKLGASDSLEIAVALIKAKAPQLAARLASEARDNQSDHDQHNLDNPLGVIAGVFAAAGCWQDAINLLRTLSEHERVAGSTKVIVEVARQIGFPALLESWQTHAAYLLTEPELEAAFSSAASSFANEQRTELALQIAEQIQNPVSMNGAVMAIGRCFNPTHKSHQMTIANEDREVLLSHAWRFLRIAERASPWEFALAFWYVLEGIGPLVQEENLLELTLWGVGWAESLQDAGSAAVALAVAARSLAETSKTHAARDVAARAQSKSQIPMEIWHSQRAEYELAHAYALLGDVELAISLLDWESDVFNPYSGPEGAVDEMERKLSSRGEQDTARKLRSLASIRIDTRLKRREQRATAETDIWEPFPLGELDFTDQEASAPAATERSTSEDHVPSQSPDGERPDLEDQVSGSLIDKVSPNLNLALRLSLPFFERPPARFSEDDWRSYLTVQARPTSDELLNMLQHSATEIACIDEGRTLFSLYLTMEEISTWWPASLQWGAAFQANDPWLRKLAGAGPYVATDS